MGGDVEGELVLERWEEQCPGRKNSRGLKRGLCRCAYFHRPRAGPTPRAGAPSAQVLLGTGELWSCHLLGRPRGLDDPGTQVPTVPGHRVASSSLQSLTSSRPGLRDLACWAWAGRLSSLGAWLFSGWAPALFHPVRAEGWGQGEALWAPPALLPDAGPGPGGCARGLRCFWLRPQLCPGASGPFFPPPRPRQGFRTAGQQQRDLSASLLAPRCLQDGVQALRRSQEARDALLVLSISSSSPLPSAYPANGSLTAPSAEVFSRHYFVPGTALVTTMDQTDPCLSGAHARGFRAPFRPGIPLLCLQLLLPPCRPCSSWQTILTLPSEAGPKCPGGLRNSVRRAWDTLNITPPDPQAQSQKLPGSEAQWTESHRRGGFPLHLQLLGFSLGLNMKNAVFTLTREKSACVLDFTFYKADFIRNILYMLSCFRRQRLSSIWDLGV